MGITNQIQKANPRKMFPIAQNGVIRGDDKKPVIAAQSKVIGMTSRPRNCQMLITTKRPREILDVEDTRERSKDLIDEDVIWSYPSHE